MSAKTVVLPNPPGACNAVTRRCSTPSRRCSTEAWRTYPAGNAGTRTFPCNSQDGSTLGAPMSEPANPPASDAIRNG